MIEATDGEDALRKLEAFGPADVALCDLCLPGMDGVAFLGAASRLGLIQSIILSSDVQGTLRNAVATLVGTLEMQFLGDLGKPFSLNKLLELLLRYEPRSVYTEPCSNPVRCFTYQDISRGLQRGEFEPYLQPKYNLGTGRLCGAEVLARWRHPELGVLLPGVFLDQAEAAGLLDELFLQLFAQGLDAQRYMPDVALAYNLEVDQLVSLGLPDLVRSNLRKRGLSASGVVFEVTETGAMQAYGASLECMIRLRLMGCGLSMDDFGAGYASLGRLCELPFDYRIRAT